MHTWKFFTNFKNKKKTYIGVVLGGERGLHNKDSTWILKKRKLLVHTQMIAISTPRHIPRSSRDVFKNTAIQQAQ